MYIYREVLITGAIMSRRIRGGYPLFIFLLLIVSLPTHEGSTTNNNSWEKVDEGLYVGKFEPANKAVSGGSKIIIIKIDPVYYSFRLLCAKEQGVRGMTVREWCRKYGLIGAVNAGMFQTDYVSNVGYMKNFKQVNNGRISSRYQSAFAFNPVNKESASARLFDLDDIQMKGVISRYNTVIQNLRLIKRPGLNRWANQPKQWSEVALGEDKNGNILFIFCRQPYSMYDFNTMLLQLPIDIVCAQHLEGGPEASIYFKRDNIEIDQFGSYETVFNENDENYGAWSIPNVIGFVKK